MCCGTMHPFRLSVYLSAYVRSDVGAETVRTKTVHAGRIGMYVLRLCGQLVRRPRALSVIVVNITNCGSAVAALAWSASTPTARMHSL